MENDAQRITDEVCIINDVARRASDVFLRASEKREEGDHQAQKG